MFVVRSITQVVAAIIYLYIYIYVCIYVYRVQDSAVRRANRYGVEGPGIEFRVGRDFSHPSITALGSTQLPVQWVPGLFPGLKRPERGVDHPATSNAKVKGRVELYLCSPSGLSWTVLE